MPRPAPRVAPATSATCPSRDTCCEIMARIIDDGHRLPGDPGQRLRRSVSMDARNCSSAGTDAAALEGQATVVERVRRGRRYRSSYGDYRRAAHGSGTRRQTGNGSWHHNCEWGGMNTVTATSPRDTHMSPVDR